MEQVVLPASAGMILSTITVPMLYTGAPRIRGDDPGTGTKIYEEIKCSPHPRG